MKKINFAVTLVLLFCGLLLHAQQSTTGVVLDAAGVPIPGATIIISGTDQGTTSDFDGNFSIETNDGDSLEISSIGFESQTLAVNGLTNLTIFLQDSVSQLEEIIVTGYSTQARGSVTGAVATVDVNDAVKVPVVNAAEVLQGRVSGVSVVTNGQPGSAPTVRIRGYGTPNNNDPLYVIDGVQTNDAFVLNSLNPSDIAQMNVLKDGAAAVYGSRASNGVIVITTKSGKATRGSKVSLEISTGMSQAVNLPQLLNAEQHGQMIWESKRNDGSALTHPQYGSGAAPVIPNTIQGISAEQSSTVNPNGTDWLDAIFDAAPTTNISFSVQNGTEKGSSLFSLNYLKRDGIQIETGYERAGIRANSSYKVGNILRVGQHLNATVDKERNGNQVETALRSSPLIPLREDDGDFSGIYATSLGLGNANTPYATLIRGKDDYNKSLRLLGDVYAELKLGDDFRFKTSLGGQMRNFSRRSYSPATPEAETGGSQTLTEQTFNQYEWVWTNTLSYTKELGDHRVEAFVGYEANKVFFKGHNVARATFLFETPDYYLLSNGEGTPIINSASESSNSLASVFASANYSFKDRYLVTATVRRDQTSRFAEENQGELFPSASFGWVIDKEDFFSSSIISNLKLRVSYGELGNQELPASNPDVSISGLNESQSFYSFTGARGSKQSGAILLSVGNPNLKWETSVSKNLGLDISLFSGKLNSSIEYFEIDTENLIVQDNQKIGTTAIDASAPYVNFGSVSNKGVDFLISYADESSSGLSYEASFNLSSYKNEVTALVNDSPTAGYSGYRGGAVTRTQVGQPISSFYGRRVTGLDTNGRFTYAEVDGTPGITDGDRDFIGSPHPDFTWGLNLNLGYKNFDLSAFFNGSQGNDIYNYSKIYSDFPTFFNGNRSVRVLNAGTGIQPALSESISNSETQPNSFFVEDGSFIRLKTLQLGYTFDDAIIQKAGLSGLRIYVSGANLFTITDYDGLDPEVVGRGAQTIGVDEGIYPQARITTVGLNINF